MREDRRRLLRERHKLEEKWPEKPIEDESDENEIRFDVQEKNNLQNIANEWIRLMDEVFFGSTQFIGIFCRMSVCI